jgi:hypothetical protein
MPCTPRHDCEYSRTRAALVLPAEKRTNERFRGLPASDERWRRTFVREMERLSAPLLNQSGTGGF